MFYSNSPWAWTGSATSFGKLAAWCVLIAALISAGNAFVRYGLDIELERAGSRSSGTCSP